MRQTIALLGLLLLPGAVLAQGRGERRPGMGRAPMMETNVVERVLEQKTDFALSTEQISKLEALSKQIDEKQKPIQEELRKQRAAGVRPRDLTDEQRAEMQTIMEKARANRESAMSELKNILNDDQEKKLEDLMAKRRERRGGRQGGR